MINFIRNMASDANREVVLLPFVRLIFDVVLAGAVLRTEPNFISICTPNAVKSKHLKEPCNLENESKLISQ